MTFERGEGRAVWTLALTQALGYACFFYIFAALLIYWQREAWLSDGVIAAGPLLATAVSAVVAPGVGRALDRGRAVAMMAAGPVIGAAALVVLAVAEGAVGWFLGWAGLGLAQALCLYDVCFGMMIRRFGPEARGAITRVTLVAGLASTLAFPAGAWLAGEWGWRGAVWVAVGVALGVMLPLQVWAARVMARGTEAEVTARDVPRLGWGKVLRMPGFVGLAVLFSLVNLNHWMLVNHIRPMLEALAVRADLAILAAAAIGPAQVAGRLVLAGAGARLGTGAAAQVTVGALVLAPGFLLLAVVWPAAAVGFAICQGAAMGIITILRPVLVAETLGQERYGAVSGMMAIPGLAAMAVAPLIGTGLVALGGVWLMIGVGFALALTAAGALAVRR
ncbi:MFS transporter [Fuscovulum ytuae]|uniref:MFS transporter n=1 Tax=Fuscovulum ytuae TaxID=3042299 RepID=A0ABY8Q923_9RHOB|nr:MFS transporter [Fuscovulum sp. YMD61]WGV17334.1 MFS transporter [Fuscovulum sp. YMD61]